MAAYLNPVAGADGIVGELEVDKDAPVPAPAEARAWPKVLPAQAATLISVLATLTAPATVAQIAARMMRAERACASSAFRVPQRHAQLSGTSGGGRASAYYRVNCRRRVT
jgi:hypothetical protein